MTGTAARLPSACGENNPRQAQCAPSGYGEKNDRDRAPSPGGAGLQPREVGIDAVPGLGPPVGQTEAHAEHEPAGVPG